MRRFNHHKNIEIVEHKSKKTKDHKNGKTINPAKTQVTHKELKRIIERRTSKVVKHSRPGRPKGKKEHRPTRESREMVQDFASIGYPHAKIAERMGMNLNTLWKHYRRELDIAEMDMMKVALNGLGEALHAKKPWAICFMLKTRGKEMGWTERTEHTGKNGAPLLDLSKLTEEELDQIARIQEKALQTLDLTPSNVSIQDPSTPSKGTLRNNPNPIYTTPDMKRHGSGMRALVQIGEQA